MTAQNDTGYADQLALLDTDSHSIPSSVGAADVDHDVRPINWITLTADEAEAEWLDLNAWVNWLRRTYGLPPAIVPPFWHRHDELVWELSALHTHWLNCYDPDASPSAPLGWHRDFADTRNRLREWVATCGTRLDRDRPTRQTTWPGEAPADPEIRTVVANRDEDFITFVVEDVNHRAAQATGLNDGIRKGPVWASPTSTDGDDLFASTAPSDATHGTGQPARV